MLFKIKMTILEYRKRSYCYISRRREMKTVARATHIEQQPVASIDRILRARV